jgi:hypothetical protein
VAIPAPYAQMINYWYASKQASVHIRWLGSVGSPDLRLDLGHIQRVPSTQQDSMDGFNTLHLFESLEARRSETIAINAVNRVAPCYKKESGRSRNGRFCLILLLIRSARRLTLYEASHQSKSAKTSAEQHQGRSTIRHRITSCRARSIKRQVRRVPSSTYGEDAYCILESSNLCGPTAEYGEGPEV